MSEITGRTSCSVALGFTLMVSPCLGAGGEATGQRLPARAASPPPAPPVQPPVAPRIAQSPSPERSRLDRRRPAPRPRALGQILNHRKIQAACPTGYDQSGSASNRGGAWPRKGTAHEY